MSRLSSKPAKTALLIAERTGGKGYVSTIDKDGKEERGGVEIARFFF